MPLFALVDGNSFYASCERVFRPDLIGKPIVVLSNNSHRPALFAQFRLLIDTPSPASSP